MGRQHGVCAAFAEPNWSRETTVAGAGQQTYKQQLRRWEVSNCTGVINSPGNDQMGSLWRRAWKADYCNAHGDAGVA